jgi:hypothetical protein
VGMACGVGEQSAGVKAPRSERRGERRIIGGKAVLCRAVCRPILPCGVGAGVDVVLVLVR